MTSKEVIIDFFNSDIANDIGVIEKFYHKDCEVHWNSSQGYKFRGFNDTVEFFKGITESYDSLRFQLSHLLEDNNVVTARYTLYASTIETEDEIPLAHYVTIIELKDNKFFRVYDMSQPADSETLNTSVFSKINS